MYLSILGDANPWWTKENWEETDKHIKTYRESRYRHEPKWLEQISLEPFSLNFVIGPRQVGKTTGIKLLIKNLIESGVEAERIAYIDCEIFANFAELRECIRELLKIRRDLVLFLDEVTSLKEWWKAVKFLIDAGKLEESSVVATGSGSLRIKKDAELFPGRMGKGRLIEVLPLSFGEYIELHGIRNYKTEYERVLEIFRKYLNTGGFLNVINGASRTEVLKGFINEIVRFNKSPEISREVLASLISKIPSALSYRAIASETSGYSYKLVQEYIEFFREIYLLGVAYLKEGGRILHRREKKIFFRDPLLLRIFSEWSSTKFLESALYEGIVQEHLLRKYGEIYYYRNRYEIDCIAGDMKVEVKAGKPHRKYPRGVRVLDEEELPGFLIEMFA